MRDASLIDADDLTAPSFMAASTHAADDPAARRLLRRGQGAFQKWPEGFAGFRARLMCETARGQIKGCVAVAPPDRVEVICDEPHLRQWLENMLRVIVAERTPRFFDDGDGRFPISFLEGRSDAPGRPVNVQARLGELRYWIDSAGRIRQVERIARGLRALTTFDELVRTTPGRVLPAVTTTTTWDVTTGTLVSSESVRDSHRRLDHVWLPAARHVSGHRCNAPVAVSLLEHELL